MDDESRVRWLATLDPGIAPYVDWLDSKGIETFESCQGGNGHAFPEPTIRFYGDNSEGFRALAAAVRRELPVAEWQVSRAGEPEGPHWELTFRAPAPLLAVLAQGTTGGPGLLVLGLDFEPGGTLVVVVVHVALGRRLQQDGVIRVYAGHRPTSLLSAPERPLARARSFRLSGES